MTYIPSSASSGDLGRFHIIKPDFSSYDNTQKYMNLSNAGCDGWCDQRANPNNSYGTADNIAWEVARNDLKSLSTGNGSGDGQFEAGTYSVFLRINYRAATVNYTHFTYPSFGGASGVTFTTDLPSSTTNSSTAFAPTTICNYFEQGGLFHISLSLNFVLESDSPWQRINTSFMYGKDHSSYSATNNGAVAHLYGITSAGAETEILKIA